MTNLSNFDLNFSDKNVQEAQQLDSSHPGAVLPAILTPKEYKPYSKNW